MNSAWEMCSDGSMLTQGNAVSLKMGWGCRECADPGQCCQPEDGLGVEDGSCSPDDNSTFNKLGKTQRNTQTLACIL